MCGAFNVYRPRGFTARTRCTTRAQYCARLVRIAREMLAKPRARAHHLSARGTTARSRARANGRVCSTSVRDAFQVHRLRARMDDERDRPRAQYLCDESVAAGAPNQLR